MRGPEMLDAREIRRLVRRRCGGRPKRIRGGAPTLLPVARGCDPRRGNLPLQPPDRSLTKLDSSCVPLLLSVLTVTSSVVRGWMQEKGMRYRSGGETGEARAGQYTGGHGQGSFRTRIGVWRSACGKDAAAGGGCGDDAGADSGGGRTRARGGELCADRSRGREGGADAADRGGDEAACGEIGAIGVDAAGAVFERGMAAGDRVALRLDCDVPGAGSVEGTGGVASSAGVACSNEVLGAGGGVCGVRLLFCE